MHLLRAWDDPTPPEVVFLTERDLTPKRGWPTLSFVGRVARRAVRRRRLQRPWFALVPNTGRVLGSDKEVMEFQCALNYRLVFYIARRWPHILERPPFAGLPPTLAAEIYAETRLRWDNTVTLYGLDSFRNFHMDVFSQLFVSVCYRRAEGIVGGKPRLLDLLGLMKSRRIKDMGKLLERFEKGRYAVFNEVERAASLKTGMYSKALPHVTQMDDLNSTRDKPIIIFSNQPKDGIMHGVSPLSEVGEYPRRTVTYRGIGYTDQ